MVRYIALVMAFVLCGFEFANAAVVKLIFRGGEGGQNLLKADGWSAMNAGDAVGSPMVADNGDDARAVRGFRQMITLNQTTPKPIVAAVWSRATNVGGSRDSDYSLYLDIEYADKTPLWGQTASFRTGTHDWQKAQVKIFPTKPIRLITVHLLLRRHSGKAEFKDATLTQLDARGGTAMFDGQVVSSKPSAPGFALRDVAVDSDYVSFENGKALGIQLAASRKTEGDLTRISARVSDSSGRDRAVSLVYTLPVANDIMLWLASPRRFVRVSGNGEYLDAARCAAGGGLLSRYPFGAMTSGREGVGIGLDLAKPAVFRVGYSAGTGELYIVFDLGLTKEKPLAEVSFCLFNFRCTEGFGGAVDAYYRAYPEFFRSRTPQQGIWMPFDRISRVQGWEDFGFKFKEGDGETQWDDAHQITTFRYTEPMTWWMKMPKDTPRTLEAAEAYAKQLAEKGDAHAKALFTSGFRDEAGRLVAQMRNEPWCDGAVWSMNSSPGIAGDVTDFKTKWNPQLREKLYGASRRGDLDGEYVDSAEGYVTAELDFAREHFAAARTPLTFSADEHRPAIYRGLIAYEYVRALAEDLHPAGKLTMANSTPHNLCWLAPYLDVMGTETDWKPGGQWRPMSDDEMMYRRVLCGPKPYCFLMNTNFGNWTRDDTERYMKRCLAYGMFPGFFSANASTNTYFSNPTLYNRDRELFKKYVPLCKLVAEAGWRPITGANCDDPKVYVERFGEKYLTVFNDSTQVKSVKLMIRGEADGRRKDLVSGTLRDLKSGAMMLELTPEGVAVLERN